MLKIVSSLCTLLSALFYCGISAEAAHNVTSNFAIDETTSDQQSKVEMINDGNFSEKISSENVAVSFSAHWCGPCRRFAPEFEDSARRLDGFVKCYKVNVDESPVACTIANIFAIPTVVVYKDGLEVGRHSGYLAEKKLTDFVVESLELPIVMQ